MRLFKFISYTGACTGIYCSYLYWSDRDYVPKNYPDTFYSTIVRRLPLNILSHFIGKLSLVEIPKQLRIPIYNYFMKIYEIDLSENEEKNLENFTTFSQLFNRNLKENSRIIDKTSNIVSPSDGVIQSRGIVSTKSHLALQIKGSSFHLDEFIGPLGARGSLSEKFPNPKNLQLHYCVIYLSPSNYHGFNSPTDWTPNLRRHFPGKLLSVRPKILSKYPSLFSINERVSYIGEWEEGLIAFSAIGAFGVGSIKFHIDPEFNNLEISEKFDANSLMHYKEEAVKASRLFKGEKLGFFRLGSTIVLFFEAPAGKYTWTVKPGEPVKLGQSLIKLSF